MFGKVVQLLGNPGETGFNVTYGIDCGHDDRHQLSFGTIMFANLALSPCSTKTYIRGGYKVKEKRDGFKDILVFSGHLQKEECEEILLVIVPQAQQMKSSAKRIAGRYYHEGILEMREGDTVEVSKSLEGEVETYMAVKAGNEMFLIKKTR